MEMIEVVVIGTEPPCPRCDLVALRAEEAAEGLSHSVAITHVAFSRMRRSRSARRRAARLGTPTNVAKAAGVAMEWDRP